MRPAGGRVPSRYPQAPRTAREPTHSSSEGRAAEHGRGWRSRAAPTRSRDPLEPTHSPRLDVLRGKAVGPRGVNEGHVSTRSWHRTPLERGHCQAPPAGEEGRRPRPGPSGRAAASAPRTDAGVPCPPRFSFPFTTQSVQREGQGRDAGHTGRAKLLSRPRRPGVPALHQTPAEPGRESAGRRGRRD